MRHSFGFFFFFFISFAGLLVLVHRDVRSEVQHARIRVRYEPVLWWQRPALFFRPSIVCLSNKRFWPLRKRNGENALYIMGCWKVATLSRDTRAAIYRRLILLHERGFGRSSGNEIGFFIILSRVKCTLMRCVGKKSLNLYTCILYEYGNLREIGWRKFGCQFRVWRKNSHKLVISARSRRRIKRRKIYRKGIVESAGAAYWTRATRKISGKDAGKSRMWKICLRRIRITEPVCYKYTLSTRETEREIEATGTFFPRRRCEIITRIRLSWCSSRSPNFTLFFLKIRARTRGNSPSAGWRARSRYTPLRVAWVVSVRTRIVADNCPINCRKNKR